MATIVAPPHIPPPEVAEGDETEGYDAHNEENENNDVQGLVKKHNDNDVQFIEEEDQKVQSTSAHTDSENDDEINKVIKKAEEEINRNESIADVASVAEKESVCEIEKQNAEIVVDSSLRTRRPPTPGSPKRSLPSTAKKKIKESEDEDTSSDEEFGCSDHGKSSYVQLRLRRKTLLKIEKFTDSDSRSRERMRSRALSPPSSSDEENLHIGWVAYPASLSSPRLLKENRTGQRVACACAQALKCIFSPVAKVCQKCRVNNKVWDSESLQEKLLEETPHEAVIDH